MRVKMYKAILYLEMSLQYKQTKEKNMNIKYRLFCWMLLGLEVADLRMTRLDIVFSGLCFHLSSYDNDTI